jgi:hypothetical protein
MKSNPVWPILMSLLFAAGCGMDGPTPSDNKPAPATPQAADNAGTTKSPSETKHADVKPAAAPSQPASVPAQALAVAETKSSAAAATENNPGETRVKAEVGMGARGRGYNKGLIGIAVTSLWATKERVALMMVQKNMDLYKAEHDGKGPKTHEEFMQKVIKENDVKLPDLPPGQKYEYDPAREELMVRMPADSDAP